MDTGIRINLGSLTTLPTTLDGRGTYIFERPKSIRKNGKGEAVVAGFARLTWTWARMSQEDWNFWNTTVLAGSASRSISASPAAKLFNHMNVLTDYSYCVILAPSFERVQNAKYINVKLEIEQILI